MLVNERRVQTNDEASSTHKQDAQFAPVVPLLANFGTRAVVGAPAAAADLPELRFGVNSGVDRRDLLEEVLDARSGINRDRHQRKIFGKGQYPPGAQIA